MWNVDAITDDRAVTWGNRAVYREGYRLHAQPLEVGPCYADDKARPCHRAWMVVWARDKADAEARFEAAVKEALP